MTTLFSNFHANNRPAFDLLADMMKKSAFRCKLSISPREKSASEAEKLRIRGNKAYSSKRLKEALKYYSESISVAPSKSEELALAFGNRSTVLFCMKKYELCLLDVNRALKNNYTPNFSEKWLKRKTDCWFRIVEENEMKVKIVQKILSDGESTLNSIEKRLFHVNNLSIDDSDLVIDHDSLDDPMWSTKFDHRFLPNFSSKVKLNTSTKWGRYWVATEDIAAGEVLSIEKCHLVTSLKFMHEYCGHCSIWCEALIPCPTCALQMYCSERCRQESYNLYHRVECKVWPLLNHDFIQSNVILVALRIFLSGTEQGVKLNDLIKDSDVYARLNGEWNCVDTPYPSDYLSLLNLRWKNDGGESFFDEYSIWFKIAALLFDVLQEINFFRMECKYETFQGFSDIQLFAGFLLFHNVSLAFQYGGAIEVDLIGMDSVLSEQVDIGIGVGSFQSLMNHSCEANTHTLRNKQRLLICSLRPIKAGEQIFTTYAYSYSSNIKRERAEIFEKLFKMECECLACVENWPTLRDLEADIYLTSNEQIIKEIEETFKWLKKSLKFAFYTDITYFREMKEYRLKKALEFNSNIRKYVKQPSLTIGICENFIELFLNKIGGNYYITQSTADCIDVYLSMLG